MLELVIVTSRTGRRVGMRTAAAVEQAARTACARVLVRAASTRGPGRRFPRRWWRSGSAGVLTWCPAWPRGCSPPTGTRPTWTCSRRVGTGGRPLPSKAWMALRRLGWAVVLPAGIRSTTGSCGWRRSAGRVLRSAAWRAAPDRRGPGDLARQPGRRTPEEWDAVRAAAPGGRRSLQRDQRPHPAGRRVRRAQGRLPAGVFELEPPPRRADALLSACDGQQAAIERHDADPRRALLRLQLPVRPTRAATGTGRGWRSRSRCRRPSPRRGAAPAHAPRPGGRVRADLAFTRAVPRAPQPGTRWRSGWTGG